jgi:hypothetical protein
VPHFNYSLPCPVNATGFIIRNTHDDVDHDAGTRGFTILDLISKKTVVNATLGNIQNMVSKCLIKIFLFTAIPPFIVLF